MNEKRENIGGGVTVCVNGEHTFGTDAFLLSDFASPKNRDIACDLGTGCGIIPLLWLRDNTGPRHVYAVDIQQNAIDLLSESSRISGLTGKLTPMCADLRELNPSQGFSGLDLITCNPPYNAQNTGILSADESAKVARHEVCCTMRDCIMTAARLLRFGGRFCLCQLPERLVDILSLMRNENIEPKRIRFVQKNKDSDPWLVLVEGKLGSKAFVKVLAPLIMYDEKHSYTDEMKKIYNRFKIFED